MVSRKSDDALVFAVNIGNDLVKLGLSKEQELLRAWSITTSKSITADEVEVIIGNFIELAEKHLDMAVLAQVEGAIIASVVPYVTDAWVQATQRTFTCRPFIVGPGLKTGLPMDYNNPAEIGADRIANLAAALDSYKASVIVIDFGTTTNLSVINADGVFCGGIIAPGLRISAEALSKGAARLSAVEIKTPSSVIGKSSCAAMQSGIVLGEVVRIDGLIEAVWQELGYQTEVVATGMDATAIAALSKHISTTDDNLTLKGLSLLYARNQSKK